MDAMDVITSLGFPTACVLFCGWAMWKFYENNRTDSLAREERLFIQVANFEVALENFNKTLIDFREELKELKVEIRDR